MRLLDAIARTVLALTLGALVVGHGFVLPLLSGESPLLDANLSRAIASPIELRIADVVAFGALLCACVMPRWADRHVATTLALVATALAGLDRLFVLPELHAAWSRVDLVTQRPVDRLAEANALAHWHLLIVVGVGLCLLAAALIAEYARAGEKVAVRPPPQPAPAPTSDLSGVVTNLSGGSVPARA